MIINSEKHGKTYIYVHKVEQESEQHIHKDNNVNRKTKNLSLHAV